MIGIPIRFKSGPNVYRRSLKSSFWLIIWSVWVCLNYSLAQVLEFKTGNEIIHPISLHTENVVVLLDASGSMADPFSGTTQSGEKATKIRIAKQALETVITQLPQDINIGLLVFSVAHPDPWLYPLRAKDNGRFLSALAMVEAGGGTPLGQYMKLGADTLLAQRENQYNYGSYRLLVITDGEANNSPELVNTYTSAIIDRQIRIDVIGVDMAAEHTLATVVDSYQRADNPKQLIEAVTKILAETSTDDQTTSDSDFELLQPLTDELAIGLIKALTSTPSNQPIENEEEVKTSTSPQTAQIAKAIQPTPDNSSKNALILIGILVLSGVIFFQFRSKQKPN